MRWKDGEEAHQGIQLVDVDGAIDQSPPACTFEPAEARRIAERLEIHYTPKHGSWLNMAEIELGVLTRQCLDRRIVRKY